MIILVAVIKNSSGVGVSILGNTGSCIRGMDGTLVPSAVPVEGLTVGTSPERMRDTMATIDSGVAAYGVYQNAKQPTPVLGLAFPGAGAKAGTCAQLFAIQRPNARQGGAFFPIAPS
jgi:hypothetical protein